MVGGFEAAVVFLFLVMPGLLLIGGYYFGLGRAQLLAGSALQTLAQAIAWSLLLLIPAAGCLGSDLASWINGTAGDGTTVEDHLTRILVVGYLTVFLPFPVAFILGRLARRYKRLQKLLGPATSWEPVARLGAESPMVKVSFTDGSDSVRGALDLSQSHFTPNGHLCLTQVDGGTSRSILSANEIKAIEFTGDKRITKTRSSGGFL